MFQKYRFHLLLHVVIFMWGFTGILGKLIEIDALFIVWHRTLIALITLLIGLYFLKLPMRIYNPKTRLKVLGVGVLVAMHWLAFYFSIQLSTASLGILCLSTTTLHVTWLEPLILKKPFSKMEFLFGILIVLSIYFVSGDFDKEEYLALGLGLLAALFAALFSIFNAKLAEETPASTITLHEMGSGLIFLSIIIFCIGKFNSHLFEMTGSDFSWLLFLGIVCTAFAFIATIEVLKRLGAFTVSLSINLEPVYTILLAIPILHEDDVLSGNFYLGTVFIVLILIVNAVYKARLKKD